MNQAKPITVLMPVYNAEKYLREAIESILIQTFKDFEFLIINDGSTDNSEEIIKSYDDDRIVLISKTNGGVSSALNTGLNAAKGKYIARFDADDICYPTRLEEQYHFMENNAAYVLIGSDADYVSQSGQFIFSYTSTGHSNEEIQQRILEKNPFIHSVVFFRKDIIIQCGGYDLGAHTFEDHLLWVKVIKLGKVCNFNKSLLKVRLNPESVTTDERLRGARFLELRRQILTRAQGITEIEEKELLTIIRSQNTPKLKQLGYHLFVAKKFLWNNYQPKLARKHLFKALKYQPFGWQIYAIILISFLPKYLIFKLYNAVK